MQTRTRARRPLAPITGALCLLALALAAGAPPPARAVQLGTADPRYLFSSGDELSALFDATVDAKASIVRFNAFWYLIAPTPPAVDGRDPADASYDFTNLDRAVRAADARGLQMLITLQRAPTWAQGPDPPPDVNPTTWMPDPSAFGNFAAAVATRYSGSYLDPDPDHIGEFLPRVQFYEPWNEGNLNHFLTPQWDDSGPVSPEVYRGLLNAGYEAIKEADPTATVVGGGTAPLETARPERVGPTLFWRQVFCLDADLQPLPSCPDPVSFDVFDHHAITARSPRVPGKGDGVRIADYSDVTEILRAAEAAGTVGGPAPHPLWSTEIYWETNPPDTATGVPPVRAAKWLEQGIYMLARQHVDVILNFFLLDPALTTPGEHGNVQGGLMYESFDRKPSFTAFRFPFVTERISKTRVRVWTKVPRAGTLKIQLEQEGPWKTLLRRPVPIGAVVTKVLKLKGRGVLRAALPGDRSLTWSQSP